MSPAKLELTNSSLLCLGVHMRIEAYGSHLVCVCVSLFRVHLLFPSTLGKGKCFYGYYTVFSKCAICRFAKQSLFFEIWQYLLTSKAFVSAYDSCKSKAVLVGCLSAYNIELFSSAT